MSQIHSITIWLCHNVVRERSEWLSQLSFSQLILCHNCINFLSFAHNPMLLQSVAMEEVEFLCLGTWWLMAWYHLVSPHVILIIWTVLTLLSTLLWERNDSGRIWIILMSEPIQLESKQNSQFSQILQWLLLNCVWCKFQNLCLFKSEHLTISALRPFETKKL